MGLSYNKLALDIKKTFIKSNFLSRITQCKWVSRSLTLIFIDPKVQTVDGKYVVVRLDDENQATFKQLIIEDGQKILQAANPD